MAIHHRHTKPTARIRHDGLLSDGQEPMMGEEQWGAISHDRAVEDNVCVQRESEPGAPSRHWARHGQPVDSSNSHGLVRMPDAGNSAGPGHGRIQRARRL